MHARSPCASATMTSMSPPVSPQREGWALRIALPPRSLSRTPAAGGVRQRVVGLLPEREWNAKTPRRRGAKGGEQLIPIHFLAPLRLGVLALTSPLRLHSRWLDRSQYCPIFRTHPPEAGGHSRFAVERRGGPPIGECTPKARRRERDRTKSELAFCWSPLFFSSSRLRVRHLNSSRAQPPTFLTHTHAAVWACHP